MGMSRPLGLLLAALCAMAAASARGPAPGKVALRKEVAEDTVQAMMLHRDSDLLSLSSKHRHSKDLVEALRRKSTALGHPKESTPLAPRGPRGDVVELGPRLQEGLSHVLREALDASDHAGGKKQKLPVAAASKMSREELTKHLIHFVGMFVNQEVSQQCGATFKQYKTKIADLEKGEVAGWSDWVKTHKQKSHFDERTCKASDWKKLCTTARICSATRNKDEEMIRKLGRSNSLQKSVIEKLQKKVAELNKILDASKSRRTYGKQLVAHRKLTKLRKAKNAEIANLRKELKGTDKKLVKAEKKVDKLQAKLPESAKKVDKLQKKLTKTEDKVYKMQKKQPGMSANKEANMMLHKDQAAKRAKLRALEQEVKVLDNKLAKSEVKVTELEKDMSKERPRAPSLPAPPPAACTDTSKWGWQDEGEHKPGRGYVPGKWREGGYSPIVTTTFNMQFASRAKLFRYRVPPKGCKKQCEKQLVKGDAKSTVSKTLKQWDCVADNLPKSAFKQSIATASSFACAHAERSSVSGGGGVLNCWGKASIYDGSDVMPPTRRKNFKFGTVSAAYEGICAIEAAPSSGLHCWPDTGEKSLSVKWKASFDPDWTALTTKVEESGGMDKASFKKLFTDPPPPKEAPLYKTKPWQMKYGLRIDDNKFISDSAFDAIFAHTFPGGRVGFGIDLFKQNRIEAMKWASVSVGKVHSCGIEKVGKGSKLNCWGEKTNFPGVSGAPLVAAAAEEEESQEKHEAPKFHKTSSGAPGGGAAGGGAAGGGAPGGGAPGGGAPGGGAPGGGAPGGGAPGGGAPGGGAPGGGAPGGGAPGGGAPGGGAPGGGAPGGGAPGGGAPGGGAPGGGAPGGGAPGGGAPGGGAPGAQVDDSAPVESEGSESDEAAPERTGRRVLNTAEASPDAFNFAAYQRIGSVAVSSVHTCITASKSLAAPSYVLHCFGASKHKKYFNAWKTPQGRKCPKGVVCLGKKATTRFSDLGEGVLSAGDKHTCAVAHDKSLLCWGSDEQKQCTGWKLPATKCQGDPVKVCRGLDPNKVKWKAVSVSVTSGKQSGHTCGITVEGKLHCWGADANQQASGLDPQQMDMFGIKVDNLRFNVISVAPAYSCAGLVGNNKPLCWGQSTATKKNVVDSHMSLTQFGGSITDTMWTPHRSCLDWHMSLRGAASCTSCSTKCRHIVTDPKRGAGFCVKAGTCPMCVPKNCCGERDRHYVYNAKTNTGVCVRETDDCQIVCEPKLATPAWYTLSIDLTGRKNVAKAASDAMHVLALNGTRLNQKAWGGLQLPAQPQLMMPSRRVCSKGCNRLLKVPKHNVPLVDHNGRKLPDKRILDIVVCQANHRVVCEATKWVRKSGSRSTITRHHMEPTGQECKVVKSVEPIAKCYGYQPALWNLGASCIVSTVLSKAPKEETDAQMKTRNEWVQSRCGGLKSSNDWRLKEIRTHCAQLHKNEICTDDKRCEVGKSFHFSNQDKTKFQKPFTKKHKEERGLHGGTHQEMTDPASCMGLTLPWAEYY